MQFEKARRVSILRNAEHIKAMAVVEAEGLESTLSLYDLPPDGEIALSEFEELATKRIRVLKKVEELKMHVNESNKERDKKDQKFEFMKEIMPLMPELDFRAPATKLVEFRRADVISHFALRLKYCQSPEAIKWFVTQEIQLFRMRFQFETPSAIKSFLRYNNFPAQMMEPAEKEEMAEEISAASGLSPDQVRTSDMWKLGAEEALEAVKKRKVFMQAGFVFLPNNQLLSMVEQRLRATINGACARANRFIGIIEEQNRLLPRLDRLANGGYGGKEYKAGDGDAITRHQIDSLARQFFPLCMSTCHSAMRKNHHLKHGARRQYGLFIKAIGVSLEEALAFFREEFTKKIDSDKFEKQYAYNIRHSYGKEGVRNDYPAFSCASIILGSTPGPDDCHGCPFKHSKEEDLKNRLKSDGLSSEDIDTILALNKMSQFDKACTLHFELRRGMAAGQLKQLITHPNQYYELAKEHSSRSIESMDTS